VCQNAGADCAHVGCVSAVGDNSARGCVKTAWCASRPRAAHLATACWSITPRCGSTRAHSMDRRKALQCASFASCMSSSYLHSTRHQMESINNSLLTHHSIHSIHEAME
jgi:hypothetical protein